MKYIIIALVIVVIMHDISIWRLNKKLGTLVAFIDEVMHKLEEYAEHTEKGADDE